MTSKIKVNILADGGDNAILTSNGSGTVTINNTALKSTPAFHAEKSAVQSISNATTTKLTFDTEIYDTDSTYDGTSKFTPGVAGKYVLFLQVQLTNAANNAYIQTYLYKNNAELNSIPMQLTSNGAGTTQDVYSGWFYTVDANSTDYYECYVRHNSGGSLNTATKQKCFFAGYKLIGV